MAVDGECPRCSAAVPAGARFCQACGAALGDGTTEERKLVTVLFADITGSTSIGERFDRKRWRVLLQRFFSVMTSTIEAWGGTVQKFMGDSVMATSTGDLMEAMKEMSTRMSRLEEEMTRRRSD